MNIRTLQPITDHLGLKRLDGGLGLFSRSLAFLLPTKLKVHLKYNCMLYPLEFPSLELTPKVHKNMWKKHTFGHIV